MNNIDLEVCDETCSGTAANVRNIGQHLITDAVTLELSDIFKALGDPTRIKLIHALLQSELCVHDLTEILNMSQSAVSHQLRFLRNIRIVKRRKVGRTVYYSLDDNHIEQIFALTLEHVKHR